MLKFLRGCLMCLATVMLANCASDGDSKSVAIEFPGSSWILERLDGISVASQSGQEIYVAFDADSSSISGFTGCNSLRGSYYQNVDTLIFGHVFTTRKACEGAMETETALLHALELTISYESEGGLLILKGGEGELARFRPQQN